MHAISFHAKRLHLATVAVGQMTLDWAGVEGMTPARFDLMCLLRQSGIALQRRFRRPTDGGKWIGSDEAVMKQRTLVKRLGLHPSTVSKMITRLEEMGWVTRSRDYDDRRVKIVEATPLGMRRIWKAMRRVFRERLMLKPFETIVRQMLPTWHVLDGIAAYFGDHSDFSYEWGSRTD